MEAREAAPQSKCGQEVTTRQPPAHRERHRRDRRVARASGTRRRSQRGGGHSVFSNREASGNFGRSRVSGKERSQAEDRHEVWLWREKTCDTVVGGS